MNLQIPPEVLRPLVREIVSEALTQFQADGQLASNGRLAYLEPEAAALLGVRGCVLRDARLRGEITATKVGGRIAYEVVELQNYLKRNREE